MTLKEKLLLFCSKLFWNNVADFIGKRLISVTLSSGMLSLAAVILGVSYYSSILLMLFVVALYIFICVSTFTVALFTLKDLQ